MTDPLPPRGDPATLYVIDAMGYVFRAFHALPPLTDPSGHPVGAVYGFTTMLQKLVRERAPAYLACAMDSKLPGQREERFPDYKANRPPPPDGLIAQISPVLEIVSAYAIPILTVEGCEADDVIASLTRIASGRAMKVVIVSSDKDLMSLVGPDVIMLDTLKDKAYDAAAVEQRWGVPPCQVPEVLALMGDSVDNVPGIAGVGPKTATDLVRKYGTVEAVIEHLDEIERPKLREILKKGAAIARLSRFLVTLREDLPLPFDVESLRYGGSDAARLRSLFQRFGFRRLLAELEAAPPDCGGGSTPPEPAPELGGAVTVVLDRKTLDEVVDACRAAGRFSIEPHGVGRAQAGADVLGIALGWDGRAAYIPIGRKLLDLPSELGLEEIREALMPLLLDSRCEKVVHDLKRALVILDGWQLGPAIRFDTMLGSYLLDPERHAHRLEQIAHGDLGTFLSDYAAVAAGQKGKKLGFHDVGLDQAAPYAGARARAILVASRRLSERIRSAEMETILRDVELPLAHVLAELERVGIALDTEELGRLSVAASEQLARLERQAHELAGVEFNLASPKQLADVLFGKLGLPVVRKTKTGLSTDSEVLEELEPLHPLAGRILEHRAIAKLKGTYIDALPRMVNSRTGRVHTSYNQAGAATGRISSNDPNLQNIPVRTELGREIRRAFRPAPGMILMSADYSQIELRVLAHLAEDRTLMAAFENDEDVHDRTAREVFGLGSGEVTPEQRRRAKAINFGVIYGKTDFGLARELGIGRAEARVFIDTYFRTYSGVASFLEQTISEARERGYVQTMLGRRRYIAELRSTNHNVRAAAERVARNAPIQGTAADILKVAMVRVARELERLKMSTRMLLTVHDELIFEVPTAEEEQAAELVSSQMAAAADLAVRLKVDVGRGPNWAACKG